MDAKYTLVEDIAGRIEPPADGTLSQTVHVDDRTKVVLFGFSEGQELSEHTAATPAILHFLSGEANVTLGPDKVKAVAGTWIHMPPHLPHSIQAVTPVTMLLTLIKNPAK
ncbi:cupin domain-containing protein [Aeoliella sp. SH292]|uniref:cupin domain-containing protein n=1 Tax=Aeoliella sp. SH292 TaxID=3454464 RepID=UPI003F9CD4C2